MVPDTDVQFGAPEASLTGVRFYLLDMSPPRVAREAGRPRLQIELRYLVLVGGEDIGEVHKKLSLLAFAAMEEPGFELERDARPPEFWLALGVRHQPCLVLRTIITKEVVRQPTKTVRRIVLETVAGTRLRGAVRGPGDIPLAGALVELRGLGLSSHTDPDGRFAFALVPEANPPMVLRIRAKGQEHVVNLIESEVREGFVTVRLELEN